MANGKTVKPLDAICGCYLDVSKLNPIRFQVLRSPKILCPFCPLGARAKGLPPLSPLIGASPRLIDISGRFKSSMQFGCTLGFTSMIRGVTEIEMHIKRTLCKS